MNIGDLIEKVMGKRCRIETTDGSVRYETVHSVKYLQVGAGGNETVPYPVTLYYNEGENEGVDIAILHSICIDAAEDNVG